MKKRFVCLKNLVRGGGVLFSLLLILSCENFFNGADLRKQIEDQVALANAPYFQILLEGSRGKFSPAKGQYQLKVTQSMDISFESDLDFQFIRWEVFNTKTDETVDSSEYIEISDPYSDETSIKLLKDPVPDMPLGVRSVVMERPQIISYTPIATGMLKDTTIQILFNCNMDPYSIYYTADEIDSLKNSGVEIFLPRDGEKKYGHIKKDGKTYFKNISITNKKTGQNINDCFEGPFFDDASTLSIVASKNGGHVIDDYTQVLVRLEKGFFYTEQGKPVEMAGSKMWMYQVNGETDTQSLVVSKSGDNDLFSVKVGGTEQISKEESHTIGTGGSGFDTLKFMKDGKLSLDIRVQEQNYGSGPSSFFMLNLKKIYGENYAELGAADQAEYNLKIDFQNVSSDEGAFKGTIDFANENLSLGDGVYEMNFDFKDRSNNSMTYPEDGKFYFAVDTKAPEISMPTVSSSNSTTYTLAWSDYIDLKKAEIIYGETGSTMTSSEPIAKGTVSGDITDIRSGKAYDVKVKFTDYAGNEIEKTIPKFLTGFELTGTPDFTGANASHADNVFLVGDKIADYGITAKKYYSDGSSVDVTSNYSIPTRSSYNSSWPLSYTYSEESISKSPVISGTYFIAKKDALTQAPTFYQASDGWWYCKFGDYPQNVSSISSYTTNPVYNGWFIGSDGYFYELCTSWVATQSGNGNMMSNGQSMANNTLYCFKVQPIEWRFASGDYNGKRLLIAKRNLDRSVYYTSTSTRSVNGSTVNPNDYKYSTLRAFLNGKYESGDPQSKTYQGSGFLQRAFTSSAQALIFEGDVDNSARSTNTQRNANEWASGNNVFAYGSTKDKVFVLSVQEATNSSYGFNTDPTWKNFGMRLVRTTDYAKAKHVFQSHWDDGKYESNWWLRSPRDSNSTQSRIVGGDAKIVHDVSVNNDTVGIVPAIVLLNGF
ncbi:MAG: hypothetical protein IKP60_05550 [Treponema sp.]|nr:hypothetical protein [Treponema sp.]